MRLISKVIFITLIIGLLSFTIQKNSVKTQLNKKLIVLPYNVYNIIQEGDIILRKGDGPLSFHLMNATKENFTHCGIIYKKNNDWHVIHSIGGSVSKQEIDGIQSISLKDFAKHSADSMLYICRPIFVNNAGEKIVKRAKYYLNLKIPFDHRFSLYSTDKFYCSELLYHIFKDVNQGKNIFVIQKKHKAYMLMFSTFFKPKNFKKVFFLKNYSKEKIN